MKFIRDGILKDAQPSNEKCTVTESGKAFIEAILSTPYPVQKWVVETK